MNTPLSWLLDADMVSEMIRPFPEPRVAAFLDGVAGEGICLSSIPAWEILNGIAASSPAGGERTSQHGRGRLLNGLFKEHIVD